MAEEFKTLPTYLQHASSMLVHNKQHRTLFICSVISLMALTSIVGVLSCPTSIRRYPEALVLEQQQLVTPTLRPERLVATTVGLDQLILTFLETALRDDTLEAQRNASARRNQTEALGSSGIEMARAVDDGADLARGRRRKELFRFYRHEQRRGLPSGRHYRRLARRSEDVASRKILSTPEAEPGVDALYSMDYDEEVALESTCVRPEYIVFTWILCLIALASALKLYYLVKTALATIIVSTYAVLILVVCKDFFSIPADEKNL